MDFQFGPSPEEYENPEKNLSGIVHTPGVTDFLSPHSLGAEAPLKPDIEGGALAGLGAPKKPTLHVGEVSPHPIMSDVLIGKTETGGEVEYLYHSSEFNFEPIAAHEYSKTNSFLGTHYPDAVEFPPAPISKPALPTLHVGEPEFVGGAGGYTGSAKTADGGTIFYNYHPSGKPIDAELYDAKGNFKNDELTPENIAFPEFSSLKKSEFEDINIPEKPTLHTGNLKPAGSTLMLGKTSSGNDIAYAYKDDLSPDHAETYGLNNNVLSFHTPDQINFPKHPLEQVAWTPEPPPKPSSMDFAQGKIAAHEFINQGGDVSPYGKPILHVGEPIWAGASSNKYKTPEGNKIAYHFKSNGNPWFANTFTDYGELSPDLKPDQLDFPSYKSPEEIVAKNKAVSPEKPTIPISTGKIEWGPDANSQVAHAHAIVKGETGHIYYDYVNGKPSKAEFFDSNGDSKYKFTPNEIAFPPHPSKPTLPKVKLASEYPEEEPIKELYQPSKPSHYPEAHFSSELSSAEIRSINEYTGSYYHQINSYVRRKSNLNEDDFERDNHHEAHMANLDSAIAKASLPEAITVYRGISANLFGKFSSRLEPGETILHQNYMSTTSRHGLAKGWKGGHTMVIETPAGTHALPVEQHSSNSGENEILFPRDTKLKLIKKSHNTLYFEVVP